MNYIILNNQDFFKDKIDLSNFQEVEDEEDRVDAVFGEITQEILEQLHKEPGRRDSILSGCELLRDVSTFVLLKISRDILLSENTKLIETLFGLFDKKRFYITVWGLNVKESPKEIEQYIVAYNKSLEYIENFPPEEEAHEDNFKFILKEIENKIL